MQPATAIKQIFGRWSPRDVEAEYWYTFAPTLVFRVAISPSFASVKFHPHVDVEISALAFGHFWQIGPNPLSVNFPNLAKFNPAAVLLLAENYC